MRKGSSIRRALVLGSATGVIAIACLSPASALGATVSASTNQGGFCQIQTNASRAVQITYSVQVNNCSARFGIRYVVSQGMAYDNVNGQQDAGGLMPMTQGPVPYQNSKTFFPMSPGDPYFTRVDVSVVLTSGVVTTVTTTRKKHKHRRRGRCHSDCSPDDRGRPRTHVTHTTTTTKQTALEQWNNPGVAGCVVSTTFIASDTLGCVLQDPA